MNKYKKALDKLDVWKDDLIELLPIVYKEWRNKEKRLKAYQEMTETVKTLQEIVNKEKAIKAILVHDYDGYVFECPVCHMEFRPNYILDEIQWDGCPYCRQKLIFKIEKEN